MPEGQRNYDGAYIGMCELQVLDDGHEAYKTIDPRQPTQALTEWSQQNGDICVRKENGIINWSMSKDRKFA